MMSDRLNRLASRLPLWKRIHNRMMMSISAQIADIVDTKFKSRKEFADSLGKKESEISKWLSGTHNYTLKSLAKIEEKLETQFLFTSEELGEKLSLYELETNNYHIFNTFTSNNISTMNDKYFSFLSAYANLHKSKAFKFMVNGHTYLNSNKLKTNILDNPAYIPTNIASLSVSSDGNLVEEFS